MSEVRLYKNINFNFLKWPNLDLAAGFQNKNMFKFHTMIQSSFNLAIEKFMYIQSDRLL